jgi:hypothetical protein
MFRGSPGLGPTAAAQQPCYVSCGIWGCSLCSQRLCTGSSRVAKMTAAVQF